MNWKRLPVLMLTYLLAAIAVIFAIPFIAAVWLLLKIDERFDD